MNCVNVLRLEKVDNLIVQRNRATLRSDPTQLRGNTVDGSGSKSLPF